MFGKQDKEEQLLDKQLNASSNDTLTNLAAHPQTEMMQLEKQKEREDLVRWQQDLNIEIDQLEHDLKRERLNNKNKWVPSTILVEIQKDGTKLYQEIMPVCNDLCMLMIKTNLRPLMGKNIMMSNLQEERILRILFSTIKTIILNICIKCDYYEVDFHDISYIRQTIQNAILPSPFRALNNGERKYLSSSTRRIESLHEGTGAPQQKKGLLGLGMAGL